MSHEKGRSMRGSAAHHSRETQTERGLSIPGTILLEICDLLSLCNRKREYWSDLHLAVKCFDPQVTCHFHSQQMARTNYFPLPICLTVILLCTWRKNRQDMSKHSGSLWHHSWINECRIKALGWGGQMDTFPMPSPGAIFSPYDTYCNAEEGGPQEPHIHIRSTATSIDRKPFERFGSFIRCLKINDD